MTTLRFILSTGSGRVGVPIVFLAIALAIIGPIIAPHDPVTPFPGLQLQPPSTSFWLGTDPSGLDVLSRILAAPRTDVVISLVGTAGAMIVGVPLGLLAGYFRGPGSATVMRISDSVSAFPALLLGMAVVAASGQQIQSVVFVLIVVNAPIYVRLTRSAAVSVRERQFIEAARSMGVGDWRIIRDHVLPHSLGPALANASVTIGFSILLTAGLSFVGAGVRVPTPEWGSMIAIGAPYLDTGSWWASIMPGLALATTVLGFALVGDALERSRDVVAGAAVARAPLSSGPLSDAVEHAAV